MGSPGRAPLTAHSGCDVGLDIIGRGLT